MRSIMNLAFPSLESKWSSLIVLAMMSLGMSVSVSSAQSSCFCGDDTGPDPEGEIKITYTAFSVAANGDQCGSEGEITIPACWPSPQPYSVIIPLVPIENNVCVPSAPEAESVVVAFKLTANASGDPVWEVTINSTINYSLDSDTCGPDETCSSSCGAGDYLFNNVVPGEGGSVLEFSISASGSCQELQEGQQETCNTEETGDGDCDGPNESEGNESPGPVGYLTGHKTERNTDLVVKLPGRDFTLIREYSSDPDFYARTSSGEYYWNGRTYTEADGVVPGFIGANWTMNVMPMLLGDSGRVGVSIPKNLTFSGVPMRTVSRFTRVTPGSELNAPIFHAVNGNNQYILSAQVDIVDMGLIDVWRVVEPGGVEKDFVRRTANGAHGPTFDVHDIVGKLVRERDKHGNEWFYQWQSLNYGVLSRDVVRLKSIYLNGRPLITGAHDEELARVDFTWHGQAGSDYEGVDLINAKPNLYGRLAEVQVIRFSGSAETVTQKARYTYLDEWDGITEYGAYEELDETYDASSGDLCQVVISERVNTDLNVLQDSSDDFYDRVFQYRYYGGFNGSGTGLPPSDMTLDGQAHQLLAVFYPEQIEHFADYVMQQAQSDIAGGSNYTNYTGGVGFNSVTEAADRLRWIRFDEDFTTPIYVSEADEIFLPGTHWSSLYQVASKLIGYNTSGDSYGRVKMQVVNAGGVSGCGCGGPGSSQLGKRYDYMYKRYNWLGTSNIGSPPAWSTLTYDGADGYSCQIVESHIQWNGVTFNYNPYRVYSHDYYWPTNYEVGDVNGSAFEMDPGVGIFKVMSVISEADSAWNSLATSSLSTDAYLGDANGGGKHWVTYNEYDFDSDPTLSKYNNYGKKIRQYTPSALDTAYVPALGDNSSTQPPTPAGIRVDQGLVYNYEYTDGYATAQSVQKGLNGIPIVITESDRASSSPRRPDLITGGRRLAGDGVTEEYAVEYAYFSGSFETDVVSSIKTTITREALAQNGPDTAINPVSWQLKNTKGQLVWAMDPDEVLTYSKYDSETGALVQIVRDADPAGAYVDTVDSITLTNFPGSFIPPSAPPSGYEELIDLYQVDQLGRVVKHTDPGGVEMFYRYEYLTTDLPDQTTGYLAERGVPYYATVHFPHELVGGGFDGPVSINWTDSAGRGLRSSSYIVDLGGGSYDPLASSLAGLYRGDEVQRSDTELMINGLPIRNLSWHNIGTLLATSGAYETQYEYDALGRMSKSIDPEGGVMQYGDPSNIGYDILDRPLSVFQGTVAGGVELISKSFYDSGQGTTQGVGNGLLTRTESYDGEGNTRVTKMWYDFRDRLIGQENPEAPHSVYAYDDLNRVIEQASFTDTTNFVTGVSDQVQDPASFAANQSTYSKIFYNNRGMQYRTQIAINPTSSATAFLESNRWYDLDGNMVASWSPNSAGTKYEYDSLDRPTVVYQTDHFGDALPGTASNLADASNVTGDHVISQVEYSYVPAGTPGAGSVELTTQRMRHHDAIESGTGEVTGALTTSNSVATYSAYVRDDAARVTDTLQYGTSSSSGFVSSTVAPPAPYVTERSTSAALISSVGFDSWGRVKVGTDPEGKNTVTKYDDLSRSVAMIESAIGVDPDTHINWVTDNWHVTWPDNAPTDRDRVTSFVYDGLSNVIKRTAHLNDGSVQVTQYDYGTTSGSSATTLDSLVASSRLLHKVHYPNETTGAADTSAGYTVTYSYNRLGELRGTSDQNGTTHRMTRDDLGRITSDKAELFGTNIDAAVKEIAASFDGHGRIASVDSLNSSSAVINSVDFEYTPLHQIATVVQDVDGAGTMAAERVEYDYANAAPAGGNYSRMSGTRYPSQAAVGTSDTTNTVTIDYAGTTGFDVINDRISRVSGYHSPSWGHTVANGLVRYSYLGQGTAVNVNYPSIDKGLDYTKDFGGASAAGTYPGFDQYGRVVWHAWVDDGFGLGQKILSVQYPSATPLIARRYGYDQMSNRTFDWDGRPGAVPQDRDWEYQYDGLDRLETAKRGSRNSFPAPTSIVNNAIAKDSRQWMLDMLGNWDNVVTDTDGDWLFEAEPTDDNEDRLFNSANEVTSRDGPSGSGITFSPTYDDAGNFANNGSSGAAKLIYTHDAWNRLVKIEREITGGAVLSVLENTFNGLNWRIVRKTDLSKGAYDGLDESRTYYYSAGWQMIEERVDSDLDGLTDYASQQVWGARYIDDAVAKRIDRNNDNTWNDAASEYFYLTDVMFSVRGLVDSSGVIQERIDYTPYGVAMHRYSADVNDDGALNTFDVLAMSAAVGASPAPIPGDAGYDPDTDLHGDGINFFDVNAFLAIYNAKVNNTVRDGWITDPTDAVWTDNTIGYDGYHFDYAGATDASSSGVYCVRHRVYDPGMGSWLERDPIPYNDGSGLYQYCVSNNGAYYDYDGQAPRPRVDLTRDVFIEIDVFDTNGGTSFEFHVYRKDAASKGGKREIGKVNAKGGWAKSHRNCKLMTRDEFRKKYGNTTGNKITRNLEKQRRRVGGGAGALSIFFILDAFTSDAQAAEFNPAAGRKCKCECVVREEISFVPNLIQSITQEPTQSFVTICDGLENGYMDSEECSSMSRVIFSEIVTSNGAGKVYRTVHLDCGPNADDCCD